MRRECRLSGQRIVVVGASGGLGNAGMTALRRAGAAAVGIDRVGEANNIIRADITNASEIKDAIAAAASALGGIDVLVNCAGVGWAQDSGKLPNDGAREIMEINFFGTWRTIAAALPYILETHGHVVNVASGVTRVPLPYGAAYAASKRAVTAYSDVLRLEYAERLTVTTLYPGYLDTDIHGPNLAQGYSVGEILPPDSLRSAGEAIVRSCVHRRRSEYTSLRTALVLRAAALWSAPFEHFLTQRLAALMRSRPDPEFLREDGVGRP